MGLFDKILGKKEKINAPDNSKLITMLNNLQMAADKKLASDKIMDELKNGDYFLLLPTSQPLDGEPYKLTVMSKDTELDVPTFRIVDGQKVLGVFTDETSLFKRLKKTTNYIGLPAKSIVARMENNEIDRVIINSGLPNMFVFSWQKRKDGPYEIPEGTVLFKGPPARPLSKDISEKLLNSFKQEPTISEVYQYMMALPTEENIRNNSISSIVLAFKVNADITDIIDATHRYSDIVGEVIKNEVLEFPVDTIIITSEKAYQDIKNIKGSLFYQKA